MVFAKSYLPFLPFTLTLVKKLLNVISCAFYVTIVFATGVRSFRASNDVGPLCVGPGSTRILEKSFSSSVFLVFV